MNAITITAGTPRNDFTGLFGFYFTVGDADIIVSDLGAWRLSGNSHTHTVSIYADGGSTPLVSATIDLSSGTVGAYKFASITPFTLSAGVNYNLVIDIVSGQDNVLDNDTTITPDTAITPIRSTYYDGVWHAGGGGAGVAYGAPNMIFTLGASYTDEDITENKIAYVRYEDVDDFGGTRHTSRIDIAVSGCSAIRIARDNSDWSAVFMDGESISTTPDNSSSDPGGNSFVRHVFNVPDTDTHVFTFCGDAFIRAIALSDGSTLENVPGLTNRVQFTIDSIPDYVKIIGWEDFTLAGTPHPLASIYAASGGTSTAICFRGYGKINVAYNDIRGYQIYIDRMLVATNTDTDTLSPSSNYQWKQVYDTADTTLHEIIIQIPFGLVQGIGADNIENSVTSVTDYGYRFHPPTMLSIGDSITCGVNTDDYHDIYSYVSAKRPGTATDGFALPLAASGIGSETMYRFATGDFNTGAFTYWAGDSDNRINQIIAQSPDILTLFLGTNDIGDGTGHGTASTDPYTNPDIGPSDFAAGYKDALLRIITGCPTLGRILCIGLLPRVTGPNTPDSTQLANWNAALSTMISDAGSNNEWTSGKVIFIDTSSMPVYEIHPTSTGHAQLAALIEPYLDIEGPYIVSATRTNSTTITILWSDASFPLKTVDGDTSGTWPGGPDNMSEADYALNNGETVTAMTFDGTTGIVTLTTDGGSGDTLSWEPSGPGNMYDNINNASTFFSLPIGGASDDTTSPTLDNLTTSTDGLTVTGTFSETVHTLSAQTTGFSIAGQTIDTWSVSGTSLTITLLFPIVRGAVLVLDFDTEENSITDLSDNPWLETGLPVDNVSTRAAGISISGPLNGGIGEASLPFTVTAIPTGAIFADGDTLTLTTSNDLTFSPASPLDLTSDVTFTVTPASGGSKLFHAAFPSQVTLNIGYTANIIFTAGSVTTQGGMGLGLGV